MNYDFHNLLSYIDFEELSRDLLQKKENFILESFKEGKDGGIDFRLAGVENDNKIIIQCKNYKNDFKYLENELSKEVSKVKKLKPKRYIFITSVGLTPGNKNTILNLFKPYILTTEDIYGENDINNLLGLSNYKDIERKHFKLWINSTNILQDFINKDIINRAEDLLFQISDTAEKFVYNESYNIAKELLDKYNFCIISGNPGIGKTSLSQMLAFSFLLENEKEWYIYDITKSISDGNKVFDSNLNQVFYINDFLGANSLRLSLKDEENELVSFINKIRRSKNKKLILNTREYILQQAKQESDMFDENNLEISKYILKLDNYTKKIRAEILYNHLYFSKLPKDYIFEIIKDGRYKEIIEHKRFHPRVIDHLTQVDKVLGIINYKSYFQEFMATLNNPSYLWKKIFINDRVSWHAKVLIYILPFCDIDRINKDIFFTQYIKLYETLSKKQNFRSIEEPHIKALNEMSYIINLEKHRIKIHDPSIIDFAKEHIFNSKELFSLVIESLDIFNPPYISASLSLLRKSSYEEAHKFYDLIEINFVKSFNNTMPSLRDLEFLNRSVLNSNKLLYEKVKDSFFDKMSNFEDAFKLDNLDASEIEILLTLIDSDSYYPFYSISIDYRKLLTISFLQVEGNSFTSSALHNIYNICNRDKNLFSKYKNKINEEFLSFHIKKELNYYSDENEIGYLESICNLYDELFNPKIRSAAIYIGNYRDRYDDNNSNDETIIYNNNNNLDDNNMEIDSMIISLKNRFS